MSNKIGGLHPEQFEKENWNGPPLWPMGYGNTLTSTELAALDTVDTVGLLVLRAVPDQYLPPNPPDAEAAWVDAESGPQCMLVFRNADAVRKHVVRLLDLADAMDAEAAQATPPPVVE